MRSRSRQHPPRRLPWPRLPFEETAAGASLAWHTAPHRQYVVTLTGRLEFETRDGATQVIEPGDILLAEDTTGFGEEPCSRWRQR